MVFVSPTKGRLTFDEMYQDLLAYLIEEPAAQYQLIVGTDSHTRHDTVFVTAIIIHRRGKGGRYFFHRSRRRAIKSLRQKIFYETTMSLNVAAQLVESLQNSGVEIDVDIHLDVGPIGDTKDLIREIVGMVSGNGYRATIKPYSFGASKVADRYTK